GLGPAVVAAVSGAVPAPVVLATALVGDADAGGSALAADVSVGADGARGAGISRSRTGCVVSGRSETAMAGWATVVAGAAGNGVGISRICTSDTACSSARPSIGRGAIAGSDGA